METTETLRLRRDWSGEEKSLMIRLHEIVAGDQFDDESGAPFHINCGRDWQLDTQGDWRAELWADANGSGQKNVLALTAFRHPGSVVSNVLQLVSALVDV